MIATIELKRNVPFVNPYTQSVVDVAEADLHSDGFTNHAWAWNAAALVAAKLGVKIVHVEAGLRSFDRSMPEEINRILTDAVSHWLFTTEAAGEENLVAEGVENSNYLLITEEELESIAAEIHHVDRGGDITYHGPGQVVGYPIFDLREWKRDGFHKILHQGRAVGSTEKIVDALPELGL